MRYDKPVELETEMRDRPAPVIEEPDNEFEERDAIPDGPAEGNDGPPSRRTRSAQMRQQLTGVSIKLIHRIRTHNYLRVL